MATVSKSQAVVVSIQTYTIMQAAMTAAKDIVVEVVLLAVEWCGWSEEDLTSSRECEAIWLFCGNLLDQSWSLRKSLLVVLLLVPPQAELLLLEPRVLLVVHFLTASSVPVERIDRDWRYFRDKVHQTILGRFGMGSTLIAVPIVRSPKPHWRWENPILSCYVNQLDCSSSPFLLGYQSQWRSTVYNGLTQMGDGLSIPKLWHPNLYSKSNQNIAISERSNPEQPTRAELAVVAILTVLTTDQKLRAS